MIEGLNGDREVYESLCHRLAEALGANAAAYVSFNTGRHLCTMTCWPRTVDIKGLKVVVEKLLHAHPNFLRYVRRQITPTCLSVEDRPDSGCAGIGRTFLREIHGCTDVADLPLSVGGQEVRRILLARAGDFTPSEMRLLRLVHRPLLALDRHLRCLTPEAAPVPMPSVELITDDYLTPRELEVLVLLAQGMLARTIATKINVSPRTVHKHLSSLYRKLDAHDRLVAVIRAQALGLIPAQP